MKNKKAKLLLLGCIKSRPNGECYIINSVSLRGSPLNEAPSLVHSSYIGELDSPEALHEVERFCKGLNLPKKYYKENNQ